MFLREFVKEFRAELNRLQDNASQDLNGVQKDLERIQKQITRIVAAIAEGTDTPALREALMSLEGDKAKRQSMIREFRRPKPIPPPHDMERLFRNRVDRLDEVLNATPEVQIAAGQILREIVSDIVLRPGNGRGRMLIEVRGDPSALAFPSTESRQNGMITVVAEEGFEPPTHGL